MPLLERPNISNAFGFGLSMSAWADAPFFKGKKVAIVGNNSWAMQQAAWAAMHARQTKIITEVETGPPSSELLDALNRLQVEFINNATVSDVLLTPKGDVRAISYELGGKYFEEDVDGVFLAPPIEPNWEQVGGEATVRELIARGVLFTAGICSGIEYDAHKELFVDGCRVAELILKL